MKKKQILIIGTSVLLLAGIGVTIGVINSRRKKVKRCSSLGGVYFPEEINPITGKKGYCATSLDISNEDNFINENGVSNENKQSNKVSPLINPVTKDISNPISELIGVKIYPRPTSDGGSGFSNVRDSAEVNTGFVNNFLGRIDYPNKIGTIISEQFDSLNPPHRWFRVRLDEPIRKGLSITYAFQTFDEAWVRADVVSFKPFDKTSSFDAIKRYDNSYQLGASVFPHSNWMLPKPQKVNFEPMIMLDDIF